MLLDYNPATRAYILRVPRASGLDPSDIMKEHGFDFSIPASTPAEAVLFTKEPYAAVAFHPYATPAAQHQLLDMQAGIDASWAKESQAHIKCPVDEELWPFQKAGVEYALRRNNTLIGDVPGLGKTAQAICFCNEISAKRVLVLCPANIRLQWVKAIRKWTTMPWPYIVYPILNGKHGVHPTANYTVVSYDLARTPAIGRALAKGTYDVLILDEGHYLKTIDAERTRAVFGGGENRTFEPFASRCGAIIDLTGTPLPNRPREAYTAARGLCFDSIDFMSEDKFTARFNPVMRRTTDEGKMYSDERVGRFGELQARLRVNFMVRREKQGPNGVMNQLALPKYDLIHVEETGAIKAALKAESLLDIDPDSLEGSDAETLGHISVVRRMMGLAIAPLAAEYAEMCLEGGEDKILVFGHHLGVLDIIQARLQKYGLVRIDGSVPPSRRQKLVDQYIAEPGCRVFLANMQSAGTGTDGLQAVCWHAIFAEADWVPGVNVQAVDRLNRIGQAQTVQADFMVARGSFSERILATAIRKNQITDKALDKRY